MNKRPQSPRLERYEEWFNELSNLIGDDHYNICDGCNVDPDECEGAEGCTAYYILRQIQDALRVEENE